MPQYRRGFGLQIAPTVFAEAIDNPLGDLSIKRGGTTELTIAQNSCNFDSVITLAENMVIRDSGLNTIIATNNAGSIDQIATMGTPLKAPEGNFAFFATADMLCPSTQSGTFTENSGELTLSADDNVFLNLGSIIPRLVYGGQVRISDIYIFYNTAHVDAEITSCLFRSLQLSDSTLTTLVTGPANSGLAATGNSFITLAIDTTLGSGNEYQIYMAIEATAGNVIIRGIEGYYHLV